MEEIIIKVSTLLQKRDERTPEPWTREGSQEKPGEEQLTHPSASWESLLQEGTRVEQSSVTCKVKKEKPGEPEQQTQTSSTIRVMHNVAKETLKMHTVDRPGCTLAVKIVSVYCLKRENTQKSQQRSIRSLFMKNEYVRDSILVCGGKNGPLINIFTV